VIRFHSVDLSGGGFREVGGAKVMLPASLHSYCYWVAATV